MSAPRAERNRKYPGSTPCHDCKVCWFCGLIVHDDKPTMHKLTCSVFLAAWSTK